MAGSQLKVSVISLFLFTINDLIHEKGLNTVPVPLLTAVIIFSHYFVMSAFL